MLKNLALLLMLCVIVPLRAEAAALSFNVAPGGLTYDPMAGVLQASGTVTAVDGLSTDVSGQPFHLSAALLGTTIDTGAGTLTAHFGAVPGTDLEVPGFLTGEFTSLVMVGALGSDFGLLSGALDLTGALAPEFGAPSVFVSLQLNMTAPFGDSLLLKPFAASLDGRVIGAPVPAPLTTAPFFALLIAFAGAFRARRVRSAQSSVQ